MEIRRANILGVQHSEKRVYITNDFDVNTFSKSKCGLAHKGFTVIKLTLVTHL